MRSLPHNHDQDVHKKFVKTTLDKMIRDKTGDLGMRPRGLKQQLEAKVASNPDYKSALHYIPTVQTISKAMGRVRQKDAEDQVGYFNPKRWDEFVVPEKLRKTLDDIPFLAADARLYQEKVNQEDIQAERFWVFLAPWGKSMMDRSVDWYIDGTFEICSK